MTDGEFEHRAFVLTNTGLAAMWIIVLIVVVGALSLSIGYLFGQTVIPDVSSVETQTTAHRAPVIHTTKTPIPSVSPTITITP